MFDKASNTKKQGDIGLGVAISYFVQQGITVSIPLTDSQDYDLIVDDGGLKRVQIKTTSNKSESGGYEVGLRVLGGNRSWNGVAKVFDNTKVDYLFVLTEEGDKYLIPADKIESKNSIVVGKNKWNEYKIGR